MDAGWKILTDGGLPQSDFFGGMNFSPAGQAMVRCWYLKSQSPGNEAHTFPLLIVKPEKSIKYNVLMNELKKSECQ
jgi:hypothetical protein